MNAGTQKYVHSKCLRRWQDSVQRLVQWRDKIDGKPLLMSPDPERGRDSGPGRGGGGPARQGTRQDNARARRGERCLRFPALVPPENEQELHPISDARNFGCRIVC